MRSDLSANFLVKKDQSFRSPRLVAVCWFQNNDPVALTSGPNPASITVNGNMLLTTPIVEDWGELADAGDAESFVNGDVRQQTVTIWNGGSFPFSDYFLMEDPENVAVDLYILFVGMDDSDKVLVDSFVIQDPIEFDEASRLLRLDLVSVAMRYTGMVGPVVASEDWPHAATSAVGRGIPMIIGSPGQVKTLCVRTAAEDELATSIVAGTQNIVVGGDLDISGFPTSGVVVIDDEKISYPSRSDTTLQSCSRGYGGTVAAAHAEGATVLEHISDHTYVVGQGPIAAISSVRVSGQIAPPEWYTVYPDLDPARIVFNRKPTFLDYSNTRSDDICFDDITAANTAIQPHHAFWKEWKSSSAILKDGNATLALVQVDEAQDAGNIAKIYLYVQHWANRAYDDEIVTVWVDGLGNIGTLTRPNQRDDFSVEGDVDLDHGHEHEQGQAHTHSHTDGGYNSNQPHHNHALQPQYTQDAWVLLQPYHLIGTTGGDGNQWHPALSIDSVGGGNVMFSQVEISGKSYSTTIKIYIPGHGIYHVNDEVDSSGWFGKNFEFDGEALNVNNIFFIFYHDAYGDESHIYEFRVKTQYYSNPVAQAPTVDTNLTTSGHNAQVSGEISKAPDDVHDLSRDNEPINITRSASATRDITDYFDLTDIVPDAGWNWFQGREVRFILSGDTPPGRDPVEVYITYTALEVEYRERQVVVSDDVTCQPVGTLSTNPAAITAHLLSERAGLPVERIDVTTWAAATEWYDANGYRLDGCLDAGLSVREALKKILTQARGRIIWSGGVVKYLVRLQQADWSPVRELTPADVQLRSISARRQRLTDIINTIDLAYRRDYTVDDTDTAYASLVQRRDTDSICQHGIRSDRDRWKFDLVRETNMAADLADFYIDSLSTPSTFYALSTYLPQFDLEKEDAITLSANFANLRKVPCIVRASDLLFGSGKNKRITLVRLLVENLRYVLVQGNFADSVAVADSLNVELGRDLDLDEIVACLDDLEIVTGREFADSVSVADLVVTTMFWAPEVTEEVIATDQLDAAIKLQVEDTVTVDDALFIWADLLSYGKGDYGLSPYGGTVVPEALVDQVAATDAISMHYAADIEDSVTVSEELIVLYAKSYGYGPYGQMTYGGES